VDVGTGIGGMEVGAEDAGARATGDTAPKAVDDVRDAADMGFIISQSFVCPVIQFRLMLFPLAVLPCE